MTELESLFADGGRAVLREAGEPDWDAALRSAGVTDGAVLSVSDALVVLRDHHSSAGNGAVAVSLAHAVIDVWSQRLGEAHPATLLQVAILGQLLWTGGRPDEGALLIERTWAAVAEAVEPGDVDRARVAAIHAALRVAQDRSSEAVFGLREASTVLASVDPSVAGSASFQLGQVMVEFGSVEEGLRLVEASVRAARYANPPGPELLSRLTVYARMVAERQPPKDAEGVHREAVEIARQVHGDHSAEVGVAQAALAGLLFRMAGRGEEALGLLDVAVSLLLGGAGPHAGSTRHVASELIERLIVVGRGALERRDVVLARASLGRAEEAALSVFGPGDARLQRIRELTERL